MATPKNTYSGLDMCDKPYAIGERPKGNYIPSIPMLTGKDAWDSLTGYYRDDMLPYPEGGTRDMDRPEEKKAWEALAPMKPPIPQPKPAPQAQVPAPAPLPAPAAPPAAAPPPAAAAPPQPQLNQQQGYWDAPQAPQALHGAYEARPSGLQPEDIMRGRLPALRSAATPEQQTAHQEYSKQFDDYLANRQRWEDQWAGQGEEGAKAFHQSYRDFAGKSVPQHLQGKTIDDQTLAGLGYKGRPAQTSGGFLGFGQTETAPAVTPQQEFDETKATRDKFFKERGAAKWNREQEFSNLFGNVPEDQVKAFVDSGEAPPRLVEMYDAFNMMDKGLGRFGAGADTGNAMNIPGASLIANASGTNVKHLADPEMQARWAGSGKVMGDESPIQRIRELVGGQRSTARRQGEAATRSHDQQGLAEALPWSDYKTAPMRLALEGLKAPYAAFAPGDLSKNGPDIPVNELFGTTTKHLDPKQMYEQYTADGMPKDQAVQKALGDRKALLDTRGTGQRMLGAVPRFGTGAARTMGAMWAPVAGAAGGGALMSQPKERSEKLRGWARDLAGIAADPWEAASGYQVGSEGGTASPSQDSLFGEFHRQGDATQQAATDPKAFAKQLAEEQATWKQMEKEIAQTPGGLSTWMAAAKDNPQVAAHLEQYQGLAKRHRTGQFAQDQGKATEYSNPSLGKELGGRMLGSGMSALPRTSQMLAGGGLGGAPGRIATNMGAFSALTPGFEAIQTGLDKTPADMGISKALGGEGPATIGQYQEAIGQRIREGTKARAPSPEELAAMTPEQQDQRMKQFEREQGSMGNKLLGSAGEIAASGIESLPQAAATVMGGKGLGSLAGKLPGAAGLAKSIADFGSRAPIAGVAGGAASAASDLVNGPAAQQQAAADLQRRTGRSLHGWEKSLFGDVPKMTPETLAGTTPPPEPTNPNMGNQPKEQPGLSEEASKRIKPEALAKADPETQQKVVNGVTNVEKRFTDQKQQAAGQKALSELQSQETTPSDQAALGNMRDQTGWSWDQTQKVYDKMDPGAKFLMWAGLGLGTISAMSGLMGEGGGMLDWIMSILGLAVAGGTAAHAGMFGQDAQKGMQGMMTKFDLGRRHLAGESPETIAKAYDPSQMAEHVIPAALAFGKITPEQTAKLDQAIQLQGGWAERASRLLGGPTVENSLAAEGFKDPTAQKNLVEGWKLYRKANPVAAQ